MRRKKTIIGVLSLALLIFALGKTYYAFELKLFSMVVENKMGQMIESVKEKADKIVASATGRESTPEVTPSVLTPGEVPIKPEKPIEMKVNGQTIVLDPTVSPKDLLGSIEKTNTMSPEEMEIIERYAFLLGAVNAEMSSALEGIEQMAIDEYIAIPSEERADRKYELMNKYLEKGKTLEKSCDDKVFSLLGEMKNELKAVKGRTAIVKELMGYYQSQKESYERRMVDRAMN